MGSNQIHQVHDGFERIIDFVANAGRKPTHGSKSFGRHQSLAAGVHFSQVLIDLFGKQRNLLLEDNRSWHGRQRAKYFDECGKRIERPPDGDDFHEMGEAAGEDEQAEGEENPQIRAELTAYQPCQQKQGLKQNCVGKENRHVRGGVGPDEPRLRKIAKTMRQVSFGEQHGAESNYGNDADTEKENAEGNANSETRLHSQLLTFPKNST